MNRRGLLALTAKGVGGALAIGGIMRCFGWGDGVATNAPRNWRVAGPTGMLRLLVEAERDLHSIDSRIFGTNLEWFNDAGGFATDEGFRRLSTLAKEMGTSVFRFPGGVLADYYHWLDGIGPAASRPVRHHPTDPGSSRNTFGTPELFKLLQATDAQGLITANAGTGTADEAAGWVAYCNDSKNPQRLRDGVSSGARIDLWEVGNELYYPENAGDPKVGLAPPIYAERFERFALAMKRVDPRISIAAIGLAQDSHIGPSSPYTDWNDVVLSRASRLMDILSVHNAYFPVLGDGAALSVEKVYPALWASPDAVEDSLKVLAQRLNRFDTGRREPLRIAVTEWGTLFSVPQVDPNWTAHTKTLGSALYLARMLQVFMGNPRVAVANHFKFSDRSFMGLIDYEGHPKVPYEAFRMMVQAAGARYLSTKWESTVPEYNCSRVGIVASRQNVPEVTVTASRSGDGSRVHLSVINRSLHNAHLLEVSLAGVSIEDTVRVSKLSAPEPTAHNGRDSPPELPYTTSSEPYSTVGTRGVVASEFMANASQPLELAPFSMATLTYSVRGSDS